MFLFLGPTTNFLHWSQGKSVTDQLVICGASESESKHLYSGLKNGRVSLLFVSGTGADSQILFFLNSDTDSGIDAGIDIYSKSVLSRLLKKISCTKYTYKVIMDRESTSGGGLKAPTVSEWTNDRCFIRRYF
jgi:hypothetical protein